MLTERQRCNSRHNYRLHKAKRIFLDNGFEVEKGYRCLSIAVWEHPDRSHAKPEETVKVSLGLNWNDEQGYQWSNSIHGNAQWNHSNDILTVIEAFRLLCERYEQNYAKTGTVRW